MTGFLNNFCDKNAIDRMMFRGFGVGVYLFSDLVKKLLFETCG